MNDTESRPINDTGNNRSSPEYKAELVSNWLIVRLLAAVVMAIVLMVFLIKNAEVIQIDFVFWQVEMSLALVLFFAMLAGALFGGFLCGWMVWRRTSLYRKIDETSI